MKSGICLLSETGQADCVIIDADSIGRAIYCEDVDNTTKIEGFTLTGGSPAAEHPGDRGGGLYCLHSSPTITHCAFVDNSAAAGGGIYIYESSDVVVTHCTFSGNSGTSAGGGIYCREFSSATISDCIFSGNSGRFGGGLQFYWYWDVSVSNCVFTGNSADYGGGLDISEATECDISNCTFSGNSANYGGGLRLTFCYPDVINCTIYGNSGAIAGGGVFSGGADTDVFNTIVAFSTQGVGFEYDLEQGGTSEFDCTDIYGNAAGDWVGTIADQADINGNLSLDPGFCDPEIGDFTLAEDSHCAPAQQPECGLIGAWDVGCGPTGTEPSTWGGIKAMYK
jgi:predicted outer membrane repeat protein